MELKYVFYELECIIFQNNLYMCAVVCTCVSMLNHNHLSTVDMRVDRPKLFFCSFGWIHFIFFLVVMDDLMCCHQTFWFQFIGVFCVKTAIKET